MRQKHLIPMAVAAGLFLLSSCGQSGSGSYKIVDTAQTKCFDDKAEISAPTKGAAFYGQDAQHTGNAPSYTNNGDGTVTDNVTGLMWQKAYKVMSYPEALKAIESFRYAGYNDWRIPSIKESYSLILFSGADVSVDSTSGGRVTATPFIDVDYFDFEYAANGNRPIDSQMLSSTLYCGSDGIADSQGLIFGVNFADGRIKGYGLGLNGDDKQFVVRFVRGAQYGENDFVDNGDGTISDKATSLMWSQEDSQAAMNWQEALAYAEEMNSKNYLGHSDWRVPNAKELQSIVDYSRSPLSTQSPAIDPIFNTSKITDEAGAEDYPFYWTSTTHENSGGENRGGAGVYVAFGRSLGNMAAMMGQGQGQMGGQGQGQMGGRPGMSQGQGQRPEGQMGQRPEGMGQGQRPEGMGQGQRPEGQMGERQQRGEGQQGQRPEGMGNGERPQRGEGQQGQGQRPEGMGNGERPQRGEGQQGQRPEGMGNGERPQRGEGQQGQRPEGAGNGERPQMGERGQGGPQGQGGQGGQARGGMRNAGGINWIDVHGAGSQRSDPKAGDASVYANGNGPQGDVIRINNYVRLVRDL